MTTILLINENFTIVQYENFVREEGWGELIEVFAPGAREARTTTTQVYYLFFYILGEMTCLTPIRTYAHF